MLLLISKHVAASKTLLVIASISAVDLVNPKSVNTTVCIRVNTNHHAAKASLNFLSDNDDADKKQLVLV